MAVYNTAVGSIVTRKNIIYNVRCSVMGGAVSSGNSNAELVDNLCREAYITQPEVEKVFRSVDRADFMTFQEGKSGERMRGVSFFYSCRVHIQTTTDWKRMKTERGGERLFIYLPPVFTPKPWKHWSELPAL